MILPEGILDLFEVTNVEEEHTGIIEETGLELRIIHIHLAERDLRDKEWHDHDGKSIILPHDSLTAPDTRYSKEFADVLKKIFGYLPNTGPLSGAVL